MPSIFYSVNKGDYVGWFPFFSLASFLLEPKHRFGAEFQISLAMPQLWQVGDTYRIACLSLKKATTYSRDAKVDATDKDKG